MLKLNRLPQKTPGSLPPKVIISNCKKEILKPASRDRSHAEKVKSENKLDHIKESTGQPKLNENYDTLEETLKQRLFTK